LKHFRLRNKNIHHSKKFFPSKKIFEAVAILSIYSKYFPALIVEQFVMEIIWAKFCRILGIDHNVGHLVVKF